MQDMRTMKDIEDKILMQISESANRILDDDKLINTLDESKDMSETINKRMESSQITQTQINETRELYRSIAKRSSIIYFVIAELNNIDHMYQWSLDYFIRFFNRRLQLSKQSDHLESRIKILIQDITVNSYENVVKGLFNRHRQLFSFQICSRIQLEEG